MVRTATPIARASLAPPPPASDPCRDHSDAVVIGISKVPARLPTFEAKGSRPRICHQTGSCGFLPDSSEAAR